MRKVSTAIFLPVLAALAYEYAAASAQRGFIADAAMPIFETPNVTGEYPFIPSEVFMKLYDTKRSARAGYKSSDYEFDFNTFTCKEQGWEELVDDREAAIYGSIFPAQEVAMMRSVDVILRSREKRVADKLFNSSNFAHAAAAVKWTSLEGCDPKADVQAAKKAVRDATGQLPNAAIMSWSTFQNAIQCKSFNDQVKYTTAVLLLPEEQQKKLLAQYLGVDEVLVGNAVYDSAAKGQRSTPVDLWSTAYCLVAKVAKIAKDLREPCIGRTFLWTNGSPSILTTETYRSEEKRGDVIRVRHDLAEEFVFSASGYLITGLS